MTGSHRWASSVPRWSLLWLSSLIRLCLFPDSCLMTFDLFSVDAVSGSGLVFIWSNVQGPFCFTDLIFPRWRWMWPLRVTFIPPADCCTVVFGSRLIHLFWCNTSSGSSVTGEEERCPSGGRRVGGAILSSWCFAVSVWGANEIALWVVTVSDQYCIS